MIIENENCLQSFHFDSQTTAMIIDFHLESQFARKPQNGIQKSFSETLKGVKQAIQGWSEAERLNEEEIKMLWTMKDLFQGHQGQLGYKLQSDDQKEEAPHQFPLLLSVIYQLRNFSLHSNVLLCFQFLEGISQNKPSLALLSETKQLRHFLFLTQSLQKKELTVKTKRKLAKVLGIWLESTEFLSKSNLEMAQCILDYLLGGLRKPKTILGIFSSVLIWNEIARQKHFLFKFRMPIFSELFLLFSRRLSQIEGQQKSKGLAKFKLFEIVFEVSKWIKSSLEFIEGTPSLKEAIINQSFIQQLLLSIECLGVFLECFRSSGSTFVEREGPFDLFILGRLTVSLLLEEKLSSFSEKALELKNNSLFSLAVLVRFYRFHNLRDKLPNPAKIPNDFGFFEESIQNSLGFGLIHFEFFHQRAISLPNVGFKSLLGQRTFQMVFGVFYEASQDKSFNLFFFNQKEK